jgi:rhomboid protease GluP
MADVDDGASPTLGNADLAAAESPSVDGTRVEQGKAGENVAAPPREELDPAARVRQFYQFLTEVTPHIWVVPAIVALNVAVYAAMVAFGVDPLQPTVASVLAWGANDASKTLGGQPWRLLTSMFVHYGAIHLCSNMFVLWYAGRRVERIFGGLRFAALYLCAGLIGSVASVAVHPQVVSAGASGAVFGIYGALTAFLLSQRGSIDAGVVKKLAGVAVFFVGYNVHSSLNSPVIDLAAHFGGLLGGAAAGWWLARPLSPSLPQEPRRPVIAFAAMFVVLAVIPRILPKPPDLPKVLAEFSVAESNAVKAYNALVESAHAHRLTDEAFAKGIEDKVLPAWRHLQLRLEAAAAQRWNPRQAQMLQAMAQYGRDREYTWTQTILALRSHDTPFLEWTKKVDSAAVEKFRESMKQVKAR